MSFVENTVVSQKENVSGITNYVLVDDSLQHTMKIEYKGIDSAKKECIVVVLEDFTAWEQMSDERQDEIMKGLINTSRLQIDKTFGCAVIEHLDKVMVEGFW